MTRPIRVLHVDDDLELADMVAAFLERQNDRFDVLTASSPDDGSAVLATHDINCIVSDYEMPGRTGLDFLEDVREEHPNVPFILYTGKSSGEVASTAMSKGATDYLEKERCTDHYEVLANAIENAVSQFRAERHAATMERRYQALFEQSEAAIAWVEYESDDPIIRDVNPAFRRMFCASVEGILGDNLDEVVVPDDESVEARVLSQKARAGQSISGILTCETLDGPCRKEVQVIPISSPNDGAISYAFATYTDVDQAAEGETHHSSPHPARTACVTDSSDASQAAASGSDVLPIRAQYDWDDTTPSTASIESIAAALNHDPLDLDPLYTTIDPDALDTLLTSPGAENLRFTFEHCGVEITVTETGFLTVRPDAAT